MPPEAIEATNETISGVIRDTEAREVIGGAGVSKARREASDDRYKRREVRPPKLPRSAASLRKDAKRLEHLIKVHKLPEHLDVDTARARAKALYQKSHEISEATRSGRS